MKSRVKFYIFSIVLSLTMVVPLASAQSGKSGSPSSPPSSTASFESQMLSYGGLQHVASALGKTVCGIQGVDADNSVVVIYDQTAFASLQAYEAFVANVQVVSSAYRTLAPNTDLETSLRTIFSERAQSLRAQAQAESNPAKRDLYQYKSRKYALSFAPVDPFSDAASLITALAIASNTENPGQVTVPDSAMAIALTHEIKADCQHKFMIVYPPMFGNGSASDYSSADIQIAIQSLNDLRTIALKSVSAGNQAFLTNYPPQKTAVKATTKGKSATDQSVDTTTDQTVLAPVSSDPVLTVALTDINGLYDSFMNSLLQTNPATGMTGSASVIQGYRLAKLLRGTQCTEGDKDADGKCPSTTDPYPMWKQKPAFVLLASVVNAGGTQHNHKTLWTALTTGDKITYSGGVVVNAFLWSSGSSSPVYVDVLRYRAPFSNVKRPVDVSGLDSGDNLR